MLLQLLEIIGSVCFAVCGIPAAVQAVRAQTSAIDWGFLGLWATGEVCMMVWAALMGYYTMVFLNYVPNLTCLLIIMTIKIKEGRAT